jgi:hypothetical protein
MRRNPERRAWAVLYSAFFIWCALAVAIPLGGRWWLHNASSPQTISMLSSGTVLVTRPDRDTPEANLPDIPIGSTIVTQTDSQAILTFTTVGGGEVLATLQVYGDTKLIITRADRPRYSTNLNPNRINVQVLVGRLRATISPTVSHPVVMWLNSKPDAVTVLGAPGSYVSLETSLDESVITVREGEATVISTTTSRAVGLHQDERAEVVANAPPNGPLPAERDWIINGSFQQPLETGWVKEIKQPIITTEDWGVVEVVTTEGRPAIHFRREGTDWGQVGITQEINRNVTDYKSLRLHLVVRVARQNIWNCGKLGTECPMTIDIKYLDKVGGERHWIKGFYSLRNDDPSFGLKSCPICNAVSSDHEQVPFGEWRTYDSGNLLDFFTSKGAEAVTIKSITISGAGHIFDSQITDIELLAQE